MSTQNRMATESVSFTCDKERRQCNDGAAPRVSAIIAAYNGERFIRPAVESILTQTFRDFELIVIDGCSTDGTPQILAELKDERLRVIRNERNLGIAKSLNKGLALAKGEYVALQDHDGHTHLRPQLRLHVFQHFRLHLYRPDGSECL